MSEYPYRPRLSVQITAEQQDRMQRLVPYGLQKQVIGCILDLVLDALEKDGDAVLAALLRRSRTLGLTPAPVAPVVEKGGLDSEH